jgi:hypothetical protein
LKNWQELIWRTERHDYEGRRVGISKLAILLVAFGLPCAIGSLIVEHSASSRWEKSFPIGAPQLVHPLTTGEQAVVIAIAIESKVIVVARKAVLQNPFAGLPRFDGVVKAGMAQRENAGSSYTATGAIVTIYRVVKCAVLPIE